MNQVANLYFNKQLVSQNLPFQRVPVVGELVWWQNNWYPVEAVGHSGSGTTAIANVSIGPVVNNLGPGPFPAGH